MRNRLIQSVKSYLQGNLDKHCANIENLLENTVAVGDHPDIVATIDKELEELSKYEDKLNVLSKYFTHNVSEREVLNG